MTGKIKISIALATYNGERWLREQLDSLARQTLLPHELVVSDDQSTDGTLDVVRAFASVSPFPVRFASNDRRLGFADNFINALRYCTGDAVAYCDQDDVWDPLKLERCASVMREDPSVVLVHHDSEEVDSDLQPLGIIGRPNRSTFRAWRSGKCSVVDMPVLGCCMLVHQRVVQAMVNCWPQSHLEYVMRTNSRGALGHDVTTSQIAPVLGRVVYVPQVFIYHRRHPKNTWSPDLNLSRNSKSAGAGSKLRAAVLLEYARLSAVTAEMYTKMAEQAGATGSNALQSHLRRVSDRDSNFALFNARRAELYEMHSVLKRVSHFMKMIHSGTYRGFGGPVVSIRSAFKDLTFALAGPAAPQFLEGIRDALHLNFNPRNG